MNYVDYDDLVEQYGTEKAILLFEEFKNNPPADPITSDFADQIVDALPDGLAIFDRAEHVLESPDSDSLLQWTEHYHFMLPKINGNALIEVGDYHYYVSLDYEDGEYYGGETFKHWEEAVEYIKDSVESISSLDAN